MAYEIFLQKVILSILVGALLGLEREYTKKQVIVGLRTFSLISLLAAITVILSEKFMFGNYLISIIGFIFVCAFALFLYTTAVKRKITAGITTNLAVIIAYILGLFVGLGLFAEAIFLSITTAVILFSRERMHNLVRHLTEKEVGDLLEFLILLGIVYPIIPQEIVVYGITIPIFTIWILAVAVSLINFVAFLGARHFKAKEEIGVISFLGGLISSTISIASLINFYKQNKRLKAIMVPGFLITTAAAMIRNFALVIGSVPETAKYLLMPVAFGSSFLLISSYLKLKKKKRVAKLHISSPFNVPKAIKLGIAFLGLFIILDISQGLGSSFFFIAAFLGGMVSSTGVSISLASLLFTGEIGALTAGMGLILSIIGSISSNYIYCYINKTPEFLESIVPVFIALIIMIVTFGLSVMLF